MAIDCMVTRSKSPITQKSDENKIVIFDSSVMKHESIPRQFIWLDHEKPCDGAPELDVTLTDLGAFRSGYPMDAERACTLVTEACRNHGFFVMVNHGVNTSLISLAHPYMGMFFELPLSEKQKSRRNRGEHSGYASSFTKRFSSKLPWKETLSFPYYAKEGSYDRVDEYFKRTMGENFSHIGLFYQKYCNVMNTLSFGIMELLGVSLRVNRNHFKQFFEENESIMRLNYYPPCKKPDLTLGTMPHCDLTSLTILHQDNVAGFQVFMDNQWCR
ncbi:Gibberellin 20 oxidase 2 [Capsicum chinense]|nr:Gibberellin 20 oxidase 2 [Capsicum chinense]